jgi:translocation and assembly module TamB
MSTRRPPARERPRTRRRRALALAGRVLAGIGLAGVFGGGLVAGIVLHINLPATRRVTSNFLARSLSGTFYGTLSIGGIERLDLRGATVSEVTVRDEGGNVVLVLSDVRIRTDVVALIGQVFNDDPKMTLVIRHVRAERAEVEVVPDPETGVPTLVRALTPVPPVAKPSEPSAPSRPIRVWLPMVDIAHVYARGHVGPLPTLELTVNDARGSVLVTQKGAAIDVKRYGMIVRGLAGADAAGTGDLHIRTPGAVWSSFDGYFGKVPLSASVYVKGQKVTASVDVPKAEPEDVRALLPDWPLQQAVAAHAEASGDLPELRTSARFEVEGARITASGPIRLAPEVGLDLDVVGRGVDIRALWPKAPKTGVDVDTALSIYEKNGKVSVDVNGTTQPTTIAGQPVPAVDVTGTFDDKGFDGKATLHERGIPLKVDFSVHPDGSIDVDANAKSFDLAGAPRVKKITDARGRATMHVKARIEKNHLDATLVADVSSFELGPVKLHQGRVSGHASGPITKLDQLDIDATATGSDLEAKGMSFAKVHASAKGPVKRPRVTAKLTDQYGPEVDAQAVLETGNKPSVRDLSVQVKREGATLTGKVKRLDLDSRDVTVKNLKLTGIGGVLTGEVRVSEGKVQVQAKGQGIDLDALSRALGLPRGMLGGRLNIDADVVADKHASAGHVRIGLGHGSLASLGGISLSVDAALDGESVSGNASAALENIGNFGMHFETELDGNPAELRAWKGIVGAAELQASNIDLSLLSHVLPTAAKIERVAGTAFARLRVERSAPTELPNVRIEIAGTHGLEMTRAPEGAAREEWKGVEVQMVGGVSGERGDASGTTQIYDAQGALITTTGTMRVDFKKIVAQPEEWLSEIVSAPVMAVLAFSERPFALFPEPIRPEGIAGSAGARMQLTGSLSEPRLSANIDAHNVGSPTSRRALPVDAHATVQYTLADGRFGAGVELSHRERRFARLAATGVYDLGDGSWTGGANLALEGAPLGVIPALAEGRVAGMVVGNVTLQRQKKDAPPQLSANVDLSQASVDQVPLGSGKVVVRSDGRELRATAELDNDSGRLDFDLRSGLDWQTGLPDVDRERRVLVSVKSDDYDAAVLSPFLREIFSRLTGKVKGQLDASFEAKRDREGKPTSEWIGHMTGNADVREGVLQIAPLGIEFSDVRCHATARELGNLTEIRISNVTAKARSEKDNVTGNAKLYLDGVRVVRGTGGIGLTEVPVLLQGVPQGTATGQATMKLEREEDRMLVTIDVPVLTTRLPQASSRSVIQVGDNPVIEVAQPLREPTEETSGGTILPWHIVVNLSNRTRIKRADLDIPVSGQPVLDLGAKTEVGGFVDLEPGGQFKAWGKNFTIESGRVMFDTPDSADPHLTATASWRGPDGTIVYVDVRGTLKDAKLSLSSDPPLSEPEIVALLFGGGGSSSGSDDTSGARSRESAGAGVLATAFNTLFSDSVVGAVELRTATNEDKASYTAAVRLSENIWFEGTYRNRLQATQEDAANTEPVDVSGAVDWRFRRNWSLRTEVGTLGTGLDLLWQYRY